MIFSTIAGSIYYGYTNEIATNALFSVLLGLLEDNKCIFYVPDKYNNRIIKNSIKK